MLRDPFLVSVLSLIIAHYSYVMEKNICETYARIPQGRQNNILLVCHQTSTFLPQKFKTITVS